MFPAWDDEDYCIGIARKSTGKTQDLQKDSIKRQSEYITEYAAKVGLPLRKICVDEGVSRDIMDGPGVAEAMELVTDPHCRLVLVETSSRIQADEYPTFKMNTTLTITDTLLYDCAGNNLNPTRAIDKIPSALRMYLNQAELETLRDNIYKANLRRALDAKVLGKMPFGIRQCKDLAGNPIKGEYEPDPERIDALRNIFKWIAAGKTAWWVIEELKRQGVRTVPTRHTQRCMDEYEDKYLEECTRHHPEGDTEWLRVQVGRLVRNPIFRGELIWNRKKTIRPRNKAGQKEVKFINRPREEWIVRESPFGVLVADPHECDRSADCADCAAGRALWDKANDVIEQRKGERKWRSNPPRPLAGLVACMRCGNRMAALPKPNGEFDFRCAAYRRKTGIPCGNKSHTLVEWKVYDALTGAFTGRGNVPGTVEVVVAPRRDVRAEIERIDAKLADCQTKLDRAEDRWTDGEWTDAQYERQQQRIGAERDELARQRAELEESTRPREVAGRSDAIAAAVARIVPHLMNEAKPIEERRALAAEFIVRIEVDNDPSGPRIRIVGR